MVTSVGMENEVGKIADMLQNGDETVTPLQLKLAQISKVIGIMCIAICIVVFGLEMIDGMGILDAFKTAVALAVAAVACDDEPRAREREPNEERKQLDEGLAGVDRSQVVIGYEPVWSIGPGKTPAGKDYITMIARFVKERTGGLDVVYGGGLKTDNAEMLASIAEIDGGLIALTRFSGEIGWYPNEYLDIIRLYLGK